MKIVQVKKRKTLNFEIYDTLKKMILNNEFGTELKLNEVQVANMLDVSPTPVREAFRMLAMDGIVEIIPWKGVFIKKYSLEEIKEVYQCRESLETLAVRLCIDNIPVEELQRLCSLVNTKHENSDEKVKVSNEIHDVIIEYSHNTRLKNLLNQLNDVLVYDRRLSTYDAARGKEIDSEHKHILQALLDKDVEKAVFYMQEHIRNGFKHIESQWDKEK